MARTDEPKTAPEVRPLGVTVLPSFQPSAITKPVPVPAPAEPAALAPASELEHARGSHLRSAETRGARSLLRRRPGLPLVAVPDEASAVPPTVASPSIPTVAPLAPVPTLAPMPPAPTAAPQPSQPVSVPDLTMLQSDLLRERERADAAEAANAVLRRRLAQLDDELAQFRPRAIVPFEDNTD